MWRNIAVAIAALTIVGCETMEDRIVQRVQARAAEAAFMRDECGRSCVAFGGTLKHSTYKTDGHGVEVSVSCECHPPVP